MMRAAPTQVGRILFLLALGTLSAPSFGAIEIFGKGSISKNHLSRTNFVTTVSAATGFAITLIPQLRIEGRYTSNGSLQKRLDATSGAVSFILDDIKTQTTIYSVGLDIDILSAKHAFTPFVFIGAGYVKSERSYYVRADEASAPVYITDPIQTGITANVGAGFRLRVARAIAFEVEAFAYGIDVHKPNPLVNVYGTVGLRIFL